MNFWNLRDLRACYKCMFVGKTVLGLIQSPEKHENKRNQFLFYYEEELSDPPVVVVNTNVEPYDPSSHKKVMGDMVPYFSTYIAPHQLVSISTYEEQHPE